MWRCETQEAQVDLTQLNNWFINARVRVWRPVITSVFQRHLPRMLQDAQRTVCVMHW
jgi:hypothetical protein